MRLVWHIKMLNDFEVPWHEFFRRYWWGGTAAGIYELRRLQIKRCGRLSQRAVLALDCCLVITRNVHMALFQGNLSPHHIRMAKMGYFVLKRAFRGTLRTKHGVFCAEEGISRDSQNKRWGVLC